MIRFHLPQLLTQNHKQKFGSQFTCHELVDQVLGYKIV